MLCYGIIPIKRERIYYRDNSQDPTIVQVQMASKLVGTHDTEMTPCHYKTCHYKAVMLETSKRGTVIYQLLSHYFDQNWFIYWNHYWLLSTTHTRARGRVASIVL